MALPSVDTQTNDQTQLAIDKLGKSIMEKASMSIQGATKAIIPNIPKMINELTMDLEKGPITSFGRVIKKLESMVQSLGLDLREYNQDLAKLLQDREEKAVKSEAAVQRLREQGVIARVNQTTKEVKILSKHEIKQEEKAIKLREQKITKLELQLKKDAHKLQTRMFGKDENQANTKKKIQENSVKLEELKALQEQKQTDISTGTTADTGRSKPLPMFVEELKGAFMEPFAAIGESFNMLKDTGKGSAELVNFLTGGIFLKAFKGLTRGIKAIGGFFTLARLALVAKFALIIGAITFVAAKIKSIVGFFQKILDWFRNSRLGKLLGLSKETPEEKAEREYQSENFGLNDGFDELDSHFKGTPKEEMPKEDVPKAEMKKMDSTESTTIVPQSDGEIKEKVKSFFKGLFEKATNMKDKAVEFAQAQKDSALNNQTVVINNAPTTVSQNQSGTVVSGYVNNKPDETIINTSSNNWRDI